MNQLSLLLYWADVIPRFGVLFFILAAILLVGVGIFFFGGWCQYRFNNDEDRATERHTREIDALAERIAKSETYYGRLDDIDRLAKKRADFKGTLAARKITTTWLIFLAPVPFILFILTCLVPGRDTIYAMAASEVAEDVAKSPEGLKARNILNRALDKLDKALTEEEPKPEAK